MDSSRVGGRASAKNCKSLGGWRPQGDSNPRYRRERAMSWASRRWGPRGPKDGGARRDRTVDLLHAMQALSQLSYGPTKGGEGTYWAGNCQVGLVGPAAQHPNRPKCGPNGGRNSARSPGKLRPSMAIPYQPRPRQIVMCDFRGFEAPEMVKRRPVVVLAAHKSNPRLVTVVPLSTTPPTQVHDFHYRLLQNPMPGAGSVSVWAKCDMIAVVSTARLELVRTQRQRARKHRRYLTIRIDLSEFNAIRVAVLSALSLQSVLTPGLG
jgi:uncharacterized protein YifN (PemK superfamily)